MEIKKAITIICTNDIPTCINNQIKQDDGTHVSKLNYASAKALKDDLVEDDVPTISTANSPLAKYSNYLMKYENFYGSSRITEVYD